MSFCHKSVSNRCSWDKPKCFLNAEKVLAEIAWGALFYWPPDKSTCAHNGTLGLLFQWTLVQSVLFALIFCCVYTGCFLVWFDSLHVFSFVSASIGKMIFHSCTLPGTVQPTIGPASRRNVHNHRVHSAQPKSKWMVGLLWGTRIYVVDPW